jgi:hypothetical protein
VGARVISDEGVIPRPTQRCRGRRTLARRHVVDGLDGMVRSCSSVAAPIRDAEVNDVTSFTCSNYRLPSVLDAVVNDGRRVSTIQFLGQMSGQPLAQHFQRRCQATGSCPCELKLLSAWSWSVCNVRHRAPPRTSRTSSQRKTFPPSLSRPLVHGPRTRPHPASAQ